MARTLAESSPERAARLIQDILVAMQAASSPDLQKQWLLVLGNTGAVQALPVVRTLYVRDFRGGAATLAIALRSSMTPEEFAGLLRGLQHPRLRLVAGSRNTLEMRVEGEAGVA